MSNITVERVLEVHHWNDTLFSFKCTREDGLRFINGQFVMIGLEVEGRPLLRAYSIVSANYDDHLEFLSIKVPDGPLTSRLQGIKCGFKRTSCPDQLSIAMKELLDLEKGNI